MANENVIHEKLQERVYKPKRTTFLEFFKKNSFFNMLIKSTIFLGVLTTIYSMYFYYEHGLFEKYFTYFSLSISIATAIILFFNKQEKKHLNENLVENTSENEYLLSLGKEVKDFYGDAKKSSFSNNIKRQILYNSEKFKRHMMILATIGAGKTYLMKGLAEQQIILGGGSFIIDGKGTSEFAKEMYALSCLYGREKDFIHINLLDMDNTHSINPLQSGSVNSLYEILISLLIGEEDQWKAKQKEFMKNVLKLLVYKRDYENQDLNFSVLTEYMSLSKLLNEAILYKDDAKRDSSLLDFIKFVASSIAIDYNEFLNHNIQIDYTADKHFYPKGRIIEQENAFLKKAFSNINGGEKIQGVYDASVSINAWRGVITTLGSDYKNVFNAKDPTTSLWEVIQHNKILFVTLPTMDSDTTPKELGRLMLGLLKSVAQQKAKLAIQPKIPFLAMFDEIGSYIINGFGLLMSKCRSLGISIIPIFQSFAQIDVVDNGKGLETKQMLDVTGTLIVMKVTSSDVTDMINKKIKQNRFLDRTYQEKRKGSSGQANAEDSFQVLQEDAIKHYEVEKMNSGEMLVVTDGEIYKAIANAERNVLEKGKVVTYEGKDLTKKIPLTQYMNKEEFFKQINKNKNHWEQGA